DRAGVVHAQAPLGDVEVVGAPVGHHAAGVLAVLPPVGEVGVHAARAEDRVVRPLRGRPQPAVPVQAGLFLLLRQVARLAGAADVDVDRLDLADAAAAHQLAGGAELVAGALLAAGLEDAVVLAGRLDHGAGLADGQRQRLLAVDVLAGLARLDSRDGVPVVRRGDDDGVDVL